MTASRPPGDIARDIADAASLIDLEYTTIVRSVSKVIREERRGVVRLTAAEIRAALAAISQMTHGNARDYSAWREQTHRTYAEWQALLRAEAKLTDAIR